MVFATAAVFSIFTGSSGSSGEGVSQAAASGQSARWTVVSSSLVVVGVSSEETRFVEPVIEARISDHFSHAATVTSHAEGRRLGPDDKAVVGFGVAVPCAELAATWARFGEPLNASLGCK